MTSVMGSDSVSARSKSSAKASVRALFAEPPPNCSTRTSGGRSRGRGGRERGLDALLDLLVRAGDLEVDGGRAAVLGQLALVARGERGGDVLDVRQALEPGDDVAHGGRERRVARADGPAALDQDLLADLVGKAGVRDGPVGHLGGAVPRVLRVEGPHPHRSAEDGGEQDEGEPAEDGLLAMGGAPAAHPGREVALRS
jgi:hypothetical protein